MLDGSKWTWLCLQEPVTLATTYSKRGPHCSRPLPTFSKSGSTSRAAAFSRSLSSLQTGSTASGVDRLLNGLACAYCTYGRGPQVWLPCV